VRQLSVGGLIVSDFFNIGQTDAPPTNTNIAQTYREAYGASMAISAGV
jgi:hypothetical protein